jgi:hypothetical protein
MNAPIGWVLPAVAAAATAVALLGGHNLAVAVPAAGVAVLAASFLFARAWSGRARHDSESPPRAPSDTDRLRLSFRSGPIGREEIVYELSRLERSFRDRDLSPPTVDELQRISRMPTEQFLGYVRDRLDRIEGTP